MSTVAAIEVMQQALAVVVVRIAAEWEKRRVSVDYTVVCDEHIARRTDCRGPKGGIRIFSLVYRENSVDIATSLYQSW